MSKTRTYSIWIDMRRRCLDQNRRTFPEYGARGITVCDRWNKFENFLEDMGSAPAGKSIDRIDNNSGYSPENCRWATPKEQGRNKRNNLLVEIDGRCVCLASAAEDLGVEYTKLYYRLITAPKLAKKAMQAMKSADDLNFEDAE